MKRRIHLIIILMTVCAILLIGLQLYWNYRSYRDNLRVFKSDTNDALEKTVDRMMDIRRDSLAVRYKHWMADTGHIVVSPSYSEKLGKTFFSIADKHPSGGDRPPFTIASSDFGDERIDSLTPEIRTRFIESFVKNVVYEGLVKLESYYFTDRLGKLMSDAFQSEVVDTAQLSDLYRKELRLRDIDADFQFHLGEYKFMGFSEIDAPPNQYAFATRFFKYGFSGIPAKISAYFPNPNVFFLKRMKWILLSSLALIGITIFCYAYTLRTMLSQRKLGQLKDDFVNNMTHELKTPIATISVAAEAIQGFGLGQALQQEYLGIIRHQSNNLTRLIDRMLSSLVADRATIHLEKIKISFSHIVTQTFNQYKPQLLACRAEVRVDIRTGELFVRGDALHLGNVVGNLLDNAIKYGGERASILLELYEENEKLVFKISNWGQGIPPEYQDKVFERFFRVPKGDVHDVKGHGLGLSYALEIVERHGGRLTCSSSISITTFTLSLPLFVHEIDPYITA